MRRPGIFSILAILLIICFTVSSCGLDPGAGNQNADSEQIQPPEGKEKNNDINESADGTKGKEITEYFDYIENSIPFKGTLDIGDNEFDFPDKLEVYDNKKLIIDSILAEQIIQNLKANNWEEHTFETLDDGSYMIKSLKKGKLIKDKKSYTEISNEFLSDSGLSDFLKDNNADYGFELQDNQGLYTGYFYLLHEGKRTGSYIRINLEGEKNCGECTMYLYDSKVVGSLDRLDLEIALKSAFFISETAESRASEGDYNVNLIEIKYIYGLPYYSFKAFGINTRTVIDGFALAVDIDKSADKEDLISKLRNFGK